MPEAAAAAVPGGNFITLQVCAERAAGAQAAQLALEEQQQQQQQPQAASAQKQQPPTSDCTAKVAAL
jgi:hypothetical protein